MGKGNGAATVQDSMAVPQKIKERPYNPAILFSIPGELIPTRLCGTKNTQIPPRMVGQGRAEGDMAHCTGERRSWC